MPRTITEHLKSWLPQSGFLNGTPVTWFPWTDWPSRLDPLFPQHMKRPALPSSGWRYFWIPKQFSAISNMTEPPIYSMKEIFIVFSPPVREQGKRKEVSRNVKQGYQSLQKRVSWEPLPANDADCILPTKPSSFVSFQWNNFHFSLSNHSVIIKIYNFPPNIVYIGPFQTAFVIHYGSWLLTGSFCHFRPNRFSNRLLTDFIYLFIKKSLASS